MKKLKVLSHLKMNNVVVFLLAIVALVLLQSAQADNVLLSEFSSSSCEGESKEVAFSKAGNCVTLSAESSAMATCSEYREFPNDSCEGAPVQVYQGCFALPSNPSVYVKLSCELAVMVSEPALVVSEQIDSACEDVEEDLVIPTDFETSYDDAIIIPVQTSAGENVSPPYGLMAILAICFVVM